MSQKVKAHFKKADPILFSYFDQVTITPYVRPTDLFIELADAIISQQLSGKAAATIFERFKKLFPKGRITAKKLLALSDDAIRACGTSWAKVRSLKDLAEKIVTKQVRLNKLQEMSDEEVIEELIKVKGIGPWTAEMFLMFALGREDVFSYGDLGLKNGIIKMYGFKKEPTRAQIEKIVAKWKPYRTHASRILWKSLELPKK